MSERSSRALRSSDHEFCVNGALLHARAGRDQRVDMKTRTRVLAALTRMEGTAALKLALFEKLKAAGMLDCEDPAAVKATEEMLRTFVAMEKGSG